MSLNRRGRGFNGGARGGGSSSITNRTTSAPWGRLKPVQVDPLEAMGFPSKGDNRYATPFPIDHFRRHRVAKLLLP
jgi:hypothetical protein